VVQWEFIIATGADNRMGWFILAQLFSTLIQLIGIGWMSDQEKNVELMILRYQLDMAERKLQRPVRPSRAEKVTLAVLVARLKRCSQRPSSQLRGLVRPVSARNRAALASRAGAPQVALGAEEPGWLATASSGTGGVDLAPGTGECELGLR
jgi:hypothetical protein